MKGTTLLLAGAIAISVISCSNDNKKAVALDACSCAAITDQNSEDYKKCKELRAADEKFEADFQKCKLAAASGITDTSKISLNKGNSNKAVKQLEDGRYILDIGNSTMGWIGEKFTGEKQNGTVGVKEGNFELKDGQLVGGKIVIDMKKIIVTDLAGEAQANLEKHLKSDDFFSSAKFPEATYVIKSATMKDNIQYEITGDLTIKGITKEMKSNMVIAPNGQGATIGGAISFDRTQFDVRFGSKKFFENLVGDQIIKDDIILKVLLKATKS